MKKKAFFITLEIVVFIILGISSVKIVFAEDMTEIQKRKNELQEQISQSNEQISDLQIELTENLEQLNTLDEKIRTYEGEIETLEQQLNEITSQVENISEKLNLVEENYNLQRNVLKNRIVVLYESGDIYFLDVLLNSNTVSDFISNYFLVGEIARYDNELLDSITTQKNQIESIKKSLTEKQLALKRLKDNKEKTIISLNNSKIIRNSYVAKLTNDEKAMQEKVDRYKAELNGLDAQITAITALNIGGDYVGGEFIWPAPGYSTITSRFGMRFHPVLKVYRKHTGTDISMPMGAYVVASNDGIVTNSSYVTGYGNMILIDHGGGLSTLYGHASELIAKVGDHVKKGDLIMKAGSTGWSTGPHLHFEVRVNGTAIDSLEFINNQSKYLNKNEDQIELNQEDDINN